MRTISRYIFKETLWPFFFGFLFFNFILFMGIIFDLTRLIFVENAPPLKIVQLIFFSLPSFFDIVIPVSLLFSILLSFGRLSADEEITALRSSGVSLLRIQSPILMFGIILTLVSLAFSAFLTPWCNQRYEQVYREILLNRPLIELKEKTIIHFNDKRLYSFNVNKGKQIMQDIIMYEFLPSQVQKFPQVTVARKGEVKEKQFLLEKVHFYRFDQKCRLLQSGSFQEQTIYLYHESTAEKIKKKDSWEMTFTEIQQKLKSEQLPPEKRKKMEIDFHGRIAIPLATLIMCILAIPMGIKVERGDKSISLGISLVVVIIYYILFLAGEFVAKANILSPFLGVWIPNFLFFFIGAWLNFKMLRT